VGRHHPEDDRRYRSPINGPVLLMALVCWVLVLAVVLLVV
jgi:hypothetical protein